MNTRFNGPDSDTTLPDFDDDDTVVDGNIIEVEGDSTEEVFDEDEDDDDYDLTDEEDD